MQPLIFFIVIASIISLKIYFSVCYGKWTFCRESEEKWESIKQISKRKKGSLLTTGFHREGISCESGRVESVSKEDIKINITYNTRKWKRSRLTKERSHITIPATVSFITLSSQATKIQLNIFISKLFPFEQFSKMTNTNKQQSKQISSTSLIQCLFNYWFCMQFFLYNFCLVELSLLFST